MEIELPRLSKKHYKLIKTKIKPRFSRGLFILLYSCRDF